MELLDPTLAKEGCFENALSLAKVHFQSKNKYFQVDGTVYKDWHWPSGCGVYLIRPKDDAQQPVIYIGMTGKVDQRGVLSKMQSFSSRVFRYTPYYFDTKNNLFCFGPVKGERPSKSKSNKPTSYSGSYALGTLAADCFVCDDIVESTLIAPAYLEAFLLQAYLHEYRRLPEANQTF